MKSRPKGGVNVDALRAAFDEAFGLRSRPFGSKSTRWVGVSDDAKGVQWNASLDRETGKAIFGVNLEGMEYDGWPIARFIERELAQPSLPTVAGQVAGVMEAHLSLWRDAWQASARLPIQERTIGSTPLVALTEAQWRDMLREAYQCLDPDRHHRGRAKQWVTLQSARVEKWVSPHLQIAISLAELHPVVSSRDVRCTHCHGKVRIHKKQVEHGPQDHLEHHSRKDSEGCRAGYHFQGIHRMSANPVV